MSTWGHDDPLRLPFTHTQVIFVYHYIQTTKLLTRNRTTLTCLSLTMDSHTLLIYVYQVIDPEMFTWGHDDLLGFSRTHAAHFLSCLDLLIFYREAIDTLMVC